MSSSAVSIPRVTGDSSHDDIRATLARCLTRGIPLDPMPSAVTSLDPSYPHAPVRVPNLTALEFRLAVRNALRYFPSEVHAELAQEFAQELRQEGHIYMRRFQPTEYNMQAYPIACYPALLPQARAMQLMIMNNLDARVAQFPAELITYGGNGSVLGNWAQFHLLMQYLSTMTDGQTLSMASGHPAGLFPSPSFAPRVVISNGMVVPNYSSTKEYQRMYAMGNSMYGQMTAGSWTYIGPQGIVHGTTITILNAGRKYLTPAASTVASSSDSVENILSGKVYLSSGLGGMSGAQGKAGKICGCVSVIAEIDPAALQKRLKQGWIDEAVSELDTLIKRIREARSGKLALAIGYQGNVVDVWERLAKEPDQLVEIGSDQTSLHNPYNGGYYPVGLSFTESQSMMRDDPEMFKTKVQESLRRQVKAINQLVEEKGLRFWDYGNAFLLEASRAQADILLPSDKTKFRYPSYIQDFVGDVFSLGFGPFRWICTSGLSEDLRKTDAIAAKVLEECKVGAPKEVTQQLDDNLHWIRKADENKMVVGSQARILYADAKARTQIALALNDAIKSGHITAPIVLSRDHHDVSGTDSPFRETSNVYDGSAFTTDMAHLNVIGDACRGATWVSIHNGGGVGWGEVTNGGFGLVLVGDDDSATRVRMMLPFDVNNGVARRAWAGNENASLAIKRSMQENPLLRVTQAHFADDEMLDKALAQ